MPDGLLGFEYNDGGRAAAGFKGTAGDCVCRSIAIATKFLYSHVYDDLEHLSGLERPGAKRRAGTRSHPSDGVFRATYERVLLAYGWRWTPTMFIGQGCKVHMRADELPSGPLVISLSGHYTCVIDGVEYSTYRSDREGTRCVYGYWEQPLVATY